MSAPQLLYLPVISPPAKDASDPPSYYAALAAHVTTVSEDGGSLKITITNPDELHPSNQFDDPPKFSTVFASTSGFASFYPSSAILPTPVRQPIDLPPNLVTTGVGTVILRVWLGDYKDFNKAKGSAAVRPSHIVFAWLQETTVRDAFAAEIAKMKFKALRKSWRDTGGTGQVPLRPALESRFLLRAMSADAEIFVSAGTVLGNASTVIDVSSTPSSNVAQLKFQTFFASVNPNSAVASPADELMDIVLDHAKSAGRARVFMRHPLAEATDVDATITFHSQFQIWDNSIPDYVPFASADVLLFKQEDGQAVPILVKTVRTNASGKVQFTAQLKRRTEVFFKYDLRTWTKGSPISSEDLSTQPHKAGKYLDAGNINNRVYAVKFLISPEYRKYIEKLRATHAVEKFFEDRGNTTVQNPSFLHSTENTLIGDMVEFERCYQVCPAPLPQNTFNVLVEGDSWFHYPLQDDLYKKLDDKIRTGLKEEVIYNRFPLQHFGDRSDQMFLNEAQRKFTIDALTEYKIDLFLVGCGGNDFAEPGIDNRDDQAQFADYFTDGYFDPWLGLKGGTKAGVPVDPLNPFDLETVERLMRNSFASLLKNHRWNLYLRRLDDQAMPKQKTQDEMKHRLLPLLAATGIDAGTEIDSAQIRGTKILNNFLIPTDFPPGKTDPLDQLLAEIFDEEWLQARYARVRLALETLLDKVAEHNSNGRKIRVISHTYTYPFFSEDPTYVAGTKVVAGTWFVNRFIEANIVDKRIQKICLKSILDNFVRLVLRPLTKPEPPDKSPYADFFEFVDVRKAIVDEGDWRDEMHLRSEGFEKVAGLIYPRVKSGFSQKFE